MRLCELKIRNYRTLESIDIPLPSTYAAICGANDSGKTNVIRAIRSLVRGEGPGPSIFPPDEEEVSIKDDFPTWKDTERQHREISFEVAIELDKARDIGFHQFVTKHLSLRESDEALRFSIAVTYSQTSRNAQLLLRPVANSTRI
jgi:predicted ATP-dependent endonuclease of OLD family